MTTQEKIAIMQAFADGKQVEAKSKNECVWGICYDPVWDWKHLDYRIRPELREPTYRPYKDFAEFKADWDKHGGWVKRKDKENYSRLIWFCKNQCEYTYVTHVWVDDGSPCGVKVED